MFRKLSYRSLFLILLLSGNGVVAPTTQVTVGGDLKTTYRRSHNTVLLNSSIPDQFSYFRNRVNLDIAIAHTGKVFKKPVFTVNALLRYVGIAGDDGLYARTSTAGIELGETMTGEHSHTMTNSLPWIKHLYGTLNVNALLRHHCHKVLPAQHILKIGAFDFSVGRGISFGSYFGQSKKFLGVLSDTADRAPFGVCLSGDIVPGKFGYELYWARFEELSGSFEQVFSHGKAHINREYPANGIGKSNDIFIFKTFVNYDAGKVGKLRTEAYSLYNDASDQRVEMKKDSKSQLFTSGSMFEFEGNGWEFGGEIAYNHGQEELYSLDRNQIQLEAHEGVYRQTYSKVLYAQKNTQPWKTEGIDSDNYPLHNTTAVVTSDAALLVSADSSFANGQKLSTTPLSLDGVEYDLYSSLDRFREGYQNTYRGWMFVLDGAYSIKLPPCIVKLAGSLGYASGDVNPHTQEQDKKYHGFIGLHENYAGKRVKSVLLLNARKITRPLSYNSLTQNVLTDNSFSDILYGGASIKLLDYNQRGDLQLNTLLYWKDKTSLAYNIQDKDFAGKADRYLGTEFNLIGTCQLYKDLFCAAHFAAFIPGGYYTSVKGMPLSTELYEQLDRSDKTGYTQQNYSLGTDVAYHISCGINYRF